MAYSSRTSLWVRLIPIVIGLIMAGGVMLRGCQRGPFGRSQVVSLTPDQETRLGAQAFRQVLQESEVLPRDHSASEIVERIGRRLAAAAERADVQKQVGLQNQKFQWEFRVVRSEQVNAFCLPGGKVVVYTGILPVCRSESGLATVMGHEIGHALAHHGAERMAQQQLVQIGQRAIAQSVSDMSLEQQRQIYGLLGAGSNYGILLPFSRKHESEADHIGIILMAAAGYDPKEASKFWVRMKERSGSSRSPEWGSTHPSHERRTQDLQTWQAEAVPFYLKSEKQPDREFRIGGPRK